MTNMIAPNAVIDPRANIGNNVRIGHFSVIGPDVTLGDNTQIDEHVVITGMTTIGDDNHFFPGA